MQTTPSIRCNLNKPTLLWLLGKVQISGTLLSALSLSRVQTSKLCYSQVGGGRNFKGKFFVQPPPPLPRLTREREPRLTGIRQPQPHLMRRNRSWPEKRERKLNSHVFKAWFLWLCNADKSRCQAAIRWVIPTPCSCQLVTASNNYHLVSPSSSSPLEVRPGPGALHCCDALMTPRISCNFARQQIKTLNIKLQHALSSAQKGRRLKVY